MSRLTVRLPALLVGALLFTSACGQDSPTSTDAQNVVTLRPGAPLHDSYPDACTDLATCVGQPATEVVAPEELRVCKKYPVGTSNPPAVQVKLDVITHNVVGSPTNITYTVQPNSCLKLWWSPGKGKIPDTLRVEELPVPGYTTQSQVSTAILVGTNFVTTATAPTAATVVNGVTGGTGVPGLLVVFTNTPIPPEPELVNIGDFVWNDLDADGIQDAGEPGIAGVPVMLSNSMTTTTDASGLYAFTGVPAGTYTVTVGTPAGYVASPTGAGTPSTDSNGCGSTVTVATGTDNTSDFGFYKLGTIGDFVWHDTDADGIQDAGEPGISGVTVSLSNGASTTTDASGGYSFGGLLPGAYTVTVATPAGYVNSPTGAGTPSTDSNGNAVTTTIASGDVNTTLDFGFYKLGTVGDFVWNDLDADGIQDAGEPGIPGVTVNLSNGASTTTDASGGYSFGSLLPGTYTVTVATPAGYVNSPTGAGTPSTDSNGNTVTTTIASGGANTTLDFGFYKLGSIGDFVWLDLNGNGLQDLGEAGVAGVVVTLGGAGSATTTTSASGYYLFPNLVPGTYTVSFALPSGFSASPSSVGPDRDIDSNGPSASVVIAGNQNVTIDFGIYQPYGTSSCGYTQGYWKNHEEKWPLPYAPTARWMQPTNLTPVTWDGLMGMSVTGGNAYMQLAHQWIAATLNRQIGAPMAPAVVTVLDQAKAWLILKTPVNGPVPNIKDTQATAWAKVLDDYNNGKLGTPHCN